MTDAAVATDTAAAAGGAPTPAGARAIAAAPGALGQNGLPQITGATLWITGVVLALANFMAVLDTTIANVSVPNIAGGLAVSSNEGTWVITSYSVAEAIAVPLTGWLASRFGAVRTFITAMVCFATFSALCGLAPSLGTLVVCRILQGFSGGPMIPLSQALLLRVFPSKQAPMAIGLWSMTTVVAPIAGPLLGGNICDNIGWPWVFYINVPVAAACAFFGMRLLANQENPTVRRPIDFVGLLLLVTWVGSLQVMLDKGQELDWFQSPFIKGLAATGATGFVAFLIWELTSADPVVNLRLFKSRAFATACGVMALTFGGFFSSVVLIPLWLQTNLGYTATWAGYATAFVGIFAVIFSPVVARLLQSGKVDPRLLISFGVFWLGGVMLYRTGFASDIPFSSMILPTLAQGFAMPFFFIPLMALGTGSLAPKDVPSGAGLINFVRTTAGAFAVSMTTTAWEDAATKNRVQLGGRLNDAPGVMDAMKRAGMSAEQALRSLDNIVQGQSVMVATDQMFLTIAGVLALAACVVWIAPKPRGKLDPNAANAH